MTENQTFSEFTENLTIKLPKVSNRLHEFAEGAAGSHGLIVEVAAIHEGLTANFNFYGGPALESAIESWTHPYPKPILLNHDLDVNPIGRVMAATMAEEADGSKYTRLQIAITDPEAVARVMDQRYLTGSVGGRSDEALCSVCGKDWSEASMFNMPCKHVRGKTYKGKLAYLERKNLSFHEYSFVNAPADKRSMVKSVTSAASATEAEEGWISSARIFDLNMNKLEVREYIESESIDMFSEMNKKKATPFYHQLKGSFLSALAAADLEEKESEVDDEKKDSILDIFEQLSDDLAASKEEETNDQTDTAEDAEEETSEEDETSEEEADETEETSEESAEEEIEAADEDAAEETDEETDEDADQEEDANEANKAQGQESPHAKDRDSNFAKPTLKTEKPVKRDVDHTRDSVDAVDNIQEGEAELSEQSELELHAATLESQVVALQEENTRLKQALHRTLVERVVDTKIAVGLVPVSERNEKIAEHSDRTASSLADSLRDLASMTHKVVVPETIENKSAAVEEDSAVVVDNGFSHEDKTEESGLDAETLFTDVLMGRRAL